MALRDEEFLRRLRATFRQEADEHLQAMSAALLEFERAPDTATAERIEAVFRHAHSLKGAARACALGEVELLCQALEDVFAACKRGELRPGPAEVDALLPALDHLRRLVEAESGPGGAPDRSEGVAARGRLSQLLRARAASPPPPTPPASPVVPVPPPARPEPAPPAVAAPPRPAENTIRVATGKLDRILLGLEELLTIKQAVAQRAAGLRACDALLAEWDRRWTGVQNGLRAQPAPGDSGLQDFLDWNLACIRTLAGRLHDLGKAAELDRREVARRVDGLLGDSKQLVLLPFSTIADLFPRLLRDLARDQGKDIDLVVRGGEVELDKRILDGIKDPLVHLVRNCVDHGIEPPGLRRERGKPSRATVVLAAAATEDNKVEITVSDDGRGIDLAAVRAAALRRSLVSAEELASFDELRTLDLIFRSEVSTSPIITEISGRGLGLAIVREQAEKLGGRALADSQPGQGTRFRLVLPASLATFRGLLVRAAGQVFVVPLAQVERVGRLAAGAIATVQNRETIRLGDRTLPLVALECVLGLPPPAATAARTLVVIGSGESLVAFGVDEVLHDEDILVKVLGRPLSRVRHIAAATVLSSGRVAPILHVGDLIKSARRAETAPPPAAPAVVEPEAPSILVAEDSITSRMLLKGILESAGYRVTTAVDGLDALTRLRTGAFDLVVSDIEMPRMTGFDLTAAIRADRRLAETPVVLVTALASSADRERGAEVGANAYIVKSDFDQSDLLDVARRLTR